MENVLQNVFVVADRIMEFLPPSGISSLLSACRMSISDRVRRRYIHFMRELSGCEDVLTDLQSHGYTISIGGIDLDALRSKVYDPEQYWQQYPKGKRIQLLVMVTAGFADRRTDGKISTTVPHLHEKMITFHMKESREYDIHFLVCASTSWLPDTLRSLASLCTPPLRPVPRYRVPSSLLMGVGNMECARLRQHLNSCESMALLPQNERRYWTP